VTELPVSEAPDPDVRRHDLAVALQAAADAYRESHSFRGVFHRPGCGAPTGPLSIR
jgi:hypothetical protein